MTTTYKINNELNGVEIYFNGKPIKEILTNLKENGFRWNGRKLCWYAKQSPSTIATAEAMANGQQATTDTPQATPTATNKKVISLADRLNFIQGSTDKSQYHYHTVGSNYTGLSTKETAVEVRKHLKKQFPEVKFSVTSTYNKIRIEIKSSPYSNIETEYNPEMTNHRRREEKKELNPELYGILDYCRLLLNSYNYDDSDSMTDYFNSHFYDSVSIDYDYTQTDQTEAVKQDIENYRNHLIEVGKVEKIQRELEYQARLKEQEEQERQYQIRQEEREKEIDYINNNVEVKEIEESEQYFVIGSQFARMNKNNTLEEYQEEVGKGDCSLKDVKITRELHFKDATALEYFSNQLLSNFDFLEGTGGAYTDDKRIQTMTDYYNMTEEERKTVQFNLLGVAVYLDGKLQFLIDSQGHNYSRYVGLVDNVTILKDDYKMDQVITDGEVEELTTQAEIITDISFNVISDNDIVESWNGENWNLYKDTLKAMLKEKTIKPTKSIIQQIPGELESLKVAMYRVLKEVDGMQEQFKEADLKQGQQITIFTMGEMLGQIGTRHTTVEEVKETEYAQYKDAIELIHKPKGKRQLYSSHYYKDILIYDGWINLPNDLLNNITSGNGFISTQGKYASFDMDQYDLVIDYLQDKGLKPLINTINPIF